MFLSVSWCYLTYHLGKFMIHLEFLGLPIIQIVMIFVLFTQQVKSWPALLRAHCSENPQYSTKIIIVLGVPIIYKHTKNNLSLPNHASQCQQTFYLVKDIVRSLFIPLTLQLVNIHPPHCG